MIFLVIYLFIFIDELENLEFKPRIMVLHKIPSFGLLDGLEMGGDVFHALDVKIGSVAEPSELEDVHRVLRRQPLTNSLAAPLFQLWDRVDVRQY